MGKRKNFLKLFLYSASYFNWSVKITKLQYTAQIYYNMEAG